MAERGGWWGGGGGVLGFFFFNDTATTEIYTLSLHDALPISTDAHGQHGGDLDRNLDSLIFGDRKPEDEAIGRYLEAVKAVTPTSSSSGPAGVSNKTSSTAHDDKVCEIYVMADNNIPEAQFFTRNPANILSKCYLMLSSHA